MLKRKTLPKSIRIHIRRAKADIRRKTDNQTDQNKMITELYAGFGVKMS
jgi:hypothetical protein